MPRKKGAFSEDVMRQAVEMVLAGQSIKSAAKATGLSARTIDRYSKKQKHTDLVIRMSPNYSVRKVFTDAEEELLVEYLINCSKMFNGLSRNEFRSLAYEMAVSNKKNMPKTWSDDEMAGREWLRCFRKRHGDKLSLRTPENTSLARAAAFNRKNVDTFYDNLSDLLQRFPSLIDGRRIYNLDETGTTTVSKPLKVLAEK